MTGFARCHRRLFEYRTRTEAGAEQTAVALHVVQIACDTLVCVLGAGVGGPAVEAAELTLSQALRMGAASAGATALASVGEHAAESAQSDEGFSMKTVLFGTVKDAAGSFVSTVTGGLLTKAFSRVMGELIIANLPAERLLELAALHGDATIPALETVAAHGWATALELCGTKLGALLADVAMNVVQTVRDHKLLTLSAVLNDAGTQLVANDFSTLLLAALLRHGVKRF